MNHAQDTIALEQPALWRFAYTDPKTQMTREAEGLERHWMPARQLAAVELGVEPEKLECILNPTKPATQVVEQRRRQLAKLTSARVA